MLTEGIVVNDTRALMKSKIYDKLLELGEADASTWERAVFQSFTGHDREDVDWRIEDNHAGYYSWVKAFDQMVEELIEDGYVRDEVNGTGRRTFTAVEVEPRIGYSYAVYPGHKSGR